MPADISPVVMTVPVLARLSIAPLLVIAFPVLLIVPLFDSAPIVPVPVLLKPDMLPLFVKLLQVEVLGLAHAASA